MTAHVVDVCSLEILTLASQAQPPVELLWPASRIDYWAADQIDGIAVPIVGHLGVPFENDLQLPFAPLQVNGREWSLSDLIDEAGSRGVQAVHLTLRPHTRAFNAPFLFVVDIAGSLSRQLCFGRTEVVEFFTDLIRAAWNSCSATARELIAGLAIDVVDLWPMGAEDEDLALTCFCATCRPTLEESGFEIDRFIVSPSPWNLALRESESRRGITYLSDLPPDISVEELLGQSEIRGFLDDRLQAKIGGRDQQLEWAESLLVYMRARHRQTTEQIRKLFEAFRDVKPDGKRILILESDDYSWTSGLFFRSCDDEELSDELWFDPSQQRYSPQSTGYRHYMWARARYFLDALADVSIDSPELSGKKRLDIMRLRIGQVRNQRISLSSVKYLPRQGKWEGYVTPTFVDELDMALPSASSDEELADGGVLASLLRVLDSGGE